MAFVETVRGPVELAKLGRTLAHEHVVTVTDWVQRDYPDLSWGGERSRVISMIGERLASARAAGIDTIIDCTAMGHSRDIAAVAEANALADVNIVVATGLYTLDALPMFFKFRPPTQVSDGTVDDVLMRMFVRDIRAGIQGTGIKAGVIKCASDKTGITANVDRVLRAVAHAHRETGTPITTHTDASSKSGLDQLRVFDEEGVDPTRVVIGHSGDTNDYDYLHRLLDAGAFVGADRFGLELPGMPDLEGRVEIVATLVEHGYEDQILLSHDSSVFSDWWPAGYRAEQPWRAAWRLELIPTRVMPALAARGVSARAIEKMLVDNPRRFLENRGGY